MYRWIFLVVAASIVITLSPAHAVDPSFLMGTMEIEFHPIQSAGIKSGCSLVYRVVSQDHVYRQGALIGIVGNISISTNKTRRDLGLSLKIGTINVLENSPAPEPPYFAYIQTPHGTTARSKYLQFDSPDSPSSRIFLYQFSDDTMKVYGDIANGEPITIGFNRNENGLDVLVPLDLTVAETTMSEGKVKRRRSNEMLLQFLACSTEVVGQVKEQLDTK